MSAFTPASEVLLRHSGDFEQNRILFAGDLQDSLPAHFESAANHAYTQQLHHWQVPSRQMGDSVRFSLVTQADDVTDSDTLIYYQPKNGPEAQFQLVNIPSLLPVGTDIFVVGENHSGICSVERTLAEYAPLNKVDSARHCGLCHGRLEKQPVFDAEKYWDEYQTENLTIKTLPGVFSRDGLDVGNQLLLSTLTPHTKGKVLDVGCGAGVLSIALANHSPKVRLALCDVSAAAVETSRTTLTTNGVEGDVIVSSIFPDMTGRFDVIISNPSFHDDMQASLDATRTLVRGTVRHSDNGGKLRIVANAFLPYPKVLDEVFDFHKVIVQTGRFRVYRTIMTRRAEKA